MFYKAVSDKKCTPSPLRRCSHYHIPNSWISNLKQQPLEKLIEPIEKQRTLSDEQQEIQKLYQIIEQLKDENNKLRSTLQQQNLQFIYENQQLSQQIINMQSEQQTIKQALIDSINEKNKMSKYIDDLSTQHQNLQILYQDAYLKLQQADIHFNQIMLLEKELKGKVDEIEILKNELQIPIKFSIEQGDNEKIYDFLKNIKQQYDDGECRSLYLYD